jgi:hypothetical protein
MRHSLCDVYWKDDRATILMLEMIATMCRADFRDNDNDNDRGGNDDNDVVLSQDR